MRKALPIIAILLALLGGGAVWLYERHVGFERAAIEEAFPPDVYAFASVRHVRKAAFAVATDEQLRAWLDVAKALALTLYDAAAPTAATPSDAELSTDTSALVDLSDHFRGQIALAALPSTEGRENADYVVAAHFWGVMRHFNENLLLALAPLARGLEATPPSLQTSVFNDTEIHSLQLDETLRSRLREYLPFLTEELTPSWAVLDGVLYVAFSPEIVQRRLTNHQMVKASDQSLALQPAISQLPTFIESHDIDLYLNAPRWLSLGQEWIEAEKSDSSISVLDAISIPAFLQQIGATDLESVNLALELSGDRTLYVGVRYTERTGLMKSLGQTPPTPPLPLPQVPILAAESLSLNVGQALGEFRRSVITAAPLAAFGYIAVSATFRKETGIDLNTALEEAFGDELTIYQSLDVGVGTNAYGRLAEVVSPDTALAIRLKDIAMAQRILDSQTTKYEARFPRRVVTESIQGYDVTLFLPPGDASLTADTLGIAIVEDRLLLGYGTLSVFRQTLGAIAQDSEPPLVTSSAAEDPLVGIGALRLDRLPTELSKFTSVFYRQMNPGREPPLAFSLYDWNSLQTLHLERRAQTFDDNSGHRYRISNQLQIP